MLNKETRTKFKRRHFLGLGIAGVGGLVTWRYVRSSDEHAIITVLKTRLNYLTLEPEGLRMFARELAARNMVSSSKLQLLDMVGPLYSGIDIPWLQNAIVDKLHHGEERVVSQYLLSSDFFDKGADIKKIVYYRDFYDPIVATPPCRNPFARPL